jgi:CBS-domain-containing membrane protein
LRPGKEDSPSGAAPRYLTTESIIARPQTPLLELVRQIRDAHADRLVVLDECDRPIGIVSAMAVLNAIAEDRERDGGTGAGPEARPFRN